MKNNISCLVFLFLLSVKMNGQVTDTIFVYDYIIVYDTIKVYDTITVEDENVVNSENYFKKNNTVENAVLAVDTATFKAELILFNKKDTATISINSIILSETNKNLEAMKKEILMLAAAMLTQTTFAQEGKINTAKSEETIPEFTIGAGAVWGFTPDGSVQGLSLKANKVHNSKLAFGVSSDIGRMYEKGWTSSGETAEIVRGNLTGFYTNLFATANYYFLGTVLSKAGLYGKAGLGLLGYKTEQSEVFIGYPGIDTYKITSLNFSAQFCMGADVKIAKGRLFGEVGAVSSLVGQRVISGSNSVSGSSYSTKDNYNIITNLGFNDVSLRIGYLLSF